MAQWPKVSFSVVSLQSPPFFSSMRRRAAGDQNGNELAQIRLVSDEQDALRFFVVDFGDEFEGVAIGLQESVNVTSSPSSSATICAVCLARTNGLERIRSNCRSILEDRFGNLMHLFFAFISQRPVAVFLVPGRSSFNGDAVAENVDFHYSSFFR